LPQLRARKAAPAHGSGKKRGLAPSPSSALAPLPPSSPALAPARPPNNGSWARAGSSLLFFSKGEPAGELGTGLWEEDLGAGLIERRTADGETSRDGRFAWHWVRIQSVRRTRTDSVLASTSTLNYYGTSGKVLWTQEDADAPAESVPAILSDNGETILAFSRKGRAWMLTVYSFTGNPRMELSLGERVTHAQLSPNGRFAFAAWSMQDGPLRLSFLDIELSERRDIPVQDLPLSRLRVFDDGTLRADGRILLKP
jgi:hypothetical protein